MIRVATLGFSEDFVGSLSIALRNRAGSNCALGDIADAQILLVDADKASEQECLQASRKGAIPVLALSGNTEALDGRRRCYAALLSKPLQFSDLIASVAALASEVRGPHATAAPESDVAGRINRASRQLNTNAAPKISQVERSSDRVKIDDFLLGLLLNPPHSGRGRSISLLQWAGGHWLAVDWQHRRVMASMRKKMLRPLAIMPLKDQNLTTLELDHEHFDALHTQVSCQGDLEEFLWLLTFWTARTNRLDILDVDQVYRLKHWPNLTRYATSDMDIPLANYWIKYPSSVNGLIEQMGITADKVLPFAACCLTCGLLESVEPTVDELSTVEAAPPSRLRKILSMALGKIAN